MTKIVELQTNHGNIRLELNSEKAPKSVENFLTYVEAGHYDGLIFHRVIKGFMIQGGGFQPGLKMTPTREAIDNEADNGLKNDKYTIAMARTSVPNSATSQFFINTTQNDFLNFKSQTPSGWGYAVFGKVTEGQDIVDLIEKTKTRRAGGHDDVPVDDVVIVKAIVISPEAETQPQVEVETPTTEAKEA